MIRRSFGSIFFRTFFLFGVLVLTLTLFFAYMAIPMQKNAFDQIMFTQAETVSRSIVQASADAIIQRDYGFIVEHNVEVLKNNSSIFYVLVSPKSGERVFVNQNSWRVLEQMNQNLQAMETGAINSQILSYDNHDNVYHFVYPIIFSGIEWGWLHIGFSNQQYNKYISQMYHQMLVIMGISLVLILLVGYFFARWIALPVSQISALATQVAGGDLTVRSTVSRSDEIGLLSQSFNRMVDSLRQSKQQLQNYNQELEIEVQSRTQELAELNVSLDKRIREEVAKSKQQEALLIHQSRLAAMGEMIGAIAHQWRQPLNALGLVLQNLRLRQQMGRLDEEFIGASMEKSDRLIGKMSSTIDDFRNFFKPNKNTEPFNILLVARSTAELLDAQLKNHNIHIRIDCPGDIEIVGLEGEFSQVLLNLINNAKDILVERKPRYPEIRISIQQISEGAVQIVVKDNGGGIPESIFDKIYDPYFTTKEEGRGTGIGLYMSKIIIENNMSGSLRAYNDAEGANFVIQLNNRPAGKLKPVSEQSVIGDA
jgi:two-component system NtrC family sensor kinase